MGFVITVFAFLHLFDESVALVDGIVQFREAVGQFAAVDKGFKTIGKKRVILVLFGKRRDFQGMAGNNRRWMRFSSTKASKKALMILPTPSYLPYST